MTLSAEQDNRTFMHFFIGLLNPVHQYNRASTAAGFVLFCILFSGCSAPESKPMTQEKHQKPTKDMTTAPSALIQKLDSMESFDNSSPDTLFEQGELHELLQLVTGPEPFIQIMRDETAPLSRRFLATEALFDGPWEGWHQDPERSRAAAQVLSAALNADGYHNRWGLPGHFAGHVGEHLLSLPEGVVGALKPALANDTPLMIEGSEAATLQEQYGYRVKDLAAYFIARYTQQDFDAETTIEDRDQAIADLEKKLQ